MIEIFELAKFFENTAALRNVSLTVEKGRIMGVVGSNGAGKSTLLRCIAGIFSPDGGFVKVDGEMPYENVDVKSRMYFVPDNPHFEPGATVDSTAKLNASFYPHFSWEKFERLCSVFQLDRKKKISAMSKGMQRQAALIAALSTVPEYLFLDEVFDGLDPVMRRLLKRVIASEVADREMTVLIASHNLRELEDFCDSVGLLHQGGVLLEKEVDELRLGMHRVQAVFREPMDAQKLREMFDLASLTHTGSLCTMVIRGEREDIEKKLEALSPLFSEFLSLSLEEVFIKEMEAVGYDFEEIVF
ncbi:MAG: ABC transporter ATP-binding protein [Clostridia bacterium]|nr:ABC transporter ATP-binding protein [Clostridia bacterium]